MKAMIIIRVTIRTVIVFLLLSVIAKNSYSYLTPVGVSYTGTAYGFVINAVDNKLYMTRLTSPHLHVFELYPDSGALASASAFQTIACTGANITHVSMALDAMKRKLYVGFDTGYLNVYDITDSGYLVTPPSQHILGVGYGVLMDNIYIDFIHNNLVWSGGSPLGSKNILVTPLGVNGLPVQDTGVSYWTPQYYHYAAVADLNVNAIYTGCYNGSSYIVRTDANGHPNLAIDLLNTGKGSVIGVMLDAANKKLYYPRGMEKYVYMHTLDDAGFVSSSDTFPVSHMYTITVMAIDSVRRKMIVAGENLDPYRLHIAYYNLDSDGKIGTLIDTGLYGSGGVIYALAYEPFYNKCYVAGIGSGPDVMLVYNGPDSAPLVPIKINNGETITETPGITLKFQHSNPCFIYVSGDLLSISNPINTKDQWVSCGGSMWKNVGDTMRAQTLEVSAVLNSGVGEKTIEVWYCGSTTGNGMDGNFSGMMKKAAVKINLIESSAMVSSIAMSRIDYSGGARIDYKVVDGRDRNVNVEIQCRTSETDWKDATAGSAGDGKTNLTATLGGTNHYFIWDIEKDMPENAKDMQIRIKASNGDSEGQWTESAKYSEPDWIGSDIRAINVSIKKSDGSWTYRVRLEWSGISDTTSTYEVQKKNDEGNWEYISSLSGTLIEVENLSDTPVYSFRVRLRTKEGLFSAFSKTVKIKLTRRLASENTFGKDGGKVYIEDFDENESNNARVEVESGTFKEDVKVSIERVSGMTYEINAKKTNGLLLTEKDFGKPVTIILAYDREEVSKFGWNEDNLAIYNFDGINWISIGGKIDKTNCLVSARVNHFSLFKVAMNVAKPVISITPDFFSPNGDGINDVLRLYFSSQEMTEKNETKIYDINGKVVRVIKPDGSNTMYWDGKDENGTLCEAGLYVCVIEAGGQRLTETIRLVK